FDGDGIVVTNLGATTDEAHSVNVQPDGKIVLAGNTSAPGNMDVAIIRYNADGSPDAQFGVGGVVKTDVANERSAAEAVAITADNKITVAGYSYDRMRIPHFTVVRLNESGSFDASFGSGDRVVTEIGAGRSHARAIAIQPDGKTVAAGYSVNAADRYFFTVVRYNVNGSLDTAFDGDGIITTDVAAGNHLAVSVLIQPDGKIAVAGIYKYNSGESAFLVVRYNADGSLDTTFDGDGIAFKKIGSNNNVVNAAALDLNGNIVLGGYSYNNGQADFTLLRFSPNGSVDTSFGNNGVVVTPVETQGSNLYSLAVQSDNKIVAGGVYLLNFSGDTGFALTRYNADGSPDASFDGDGIVTSNFGPGEDNIYSIRLQPDGKIIAAGIHYGATTGGNNFAVARYNPNGSPDPAWGTNGVVFADFNSGLETLNAVAIDRFGRVVAVGESNWLMAAARFKGDVEVTVTASISGRVVNTSGRGIANARITLSDSTGVVRIARTNPFGYYRFTGLAAGREYFLSVGSKQIYTFAPSVLRINLFEDYAQADFIGAFEP
ncbi:MAG: carboxypeptidase regulatory-like domain-containing protein, partial [Acidobacteriota bacterium]|nr:carboxypeptidase regulatory-like domain-containing protein [Acidobacteriota bacterium]